MRIGPTLLHSAANLRRVISTGRRASPKPAQHSCKSKARRETMNNFAINRNLKAIRTGEYVHKSINEDAGEFILNEESDLHVATLKEIAEANSIKLSSTRKADILTEIIENLNERNLPIMSDKPQSELVREIVEAGHEAGKSEDDMLVEIVQAGVKFSAAMKLFRQTMTELGLRLSPKDKRELVNEILGDDFAPETADDMQEAVEKIASHDAISPQQARSAVRRYLKEHEREIPKAVKQAATGGIRAKIFDWLVENPNAGEEEFAEALTEMQSDPEKREKLEKRYTPIRLLVNRVASAES